MKKRVTPSKSTARSELLFGDRGRGLVVTTRCWLWVLGWHESVTGILESPELPVVGLVGAAPSGVCSGVWGMLGHGVGDVAPPPGVGLVRGTEAGPSACVLVVVTTVVDTGATEGGVGAGVTGLLVMSATGPVVNTCVVGPGVDPLNAWRGVGGVGLPVEWLGVCSEGLCVPMGVLALAMVAAVGGALVSSVIRGTAFIDVLPLGACVPGAPGAVVGDREGSANIGVNGTDTSEVVWSGGRAVTAEVFTAVLCFPAVVARELLPTEVLLANVTGKSVITVIFSDVLLEVLLVVSSGTLFLTKLSCIWLKVERRGSGDATRPSEKHEEETHTSTRAVHILRGSQEQGRVVPQAPIQAFSGCRQHPAAWPRDQRQMLRVCSQAEPSSSSESCRLGAVCSSGEVCVLTR